MIAENYDTQLVRAIKELECAFVVYERACLYYDGSHFSKRSIDTNLSYVRDIVDVEKILVNGIPLISNVQNILIFSSLHLISSRILNTYDTAWNILVSRLESSAETYSQYWQEEDKRGITLHDRGLRIARITQDALVDKFETLSRHILQSLKIDSEQGDWCIYDIEFDLLREHCMLIIDEITHICSKIDRLQDLTISNTQISSAKKSLRYAVVGIAVSAALSFVSLFKGGSPVVVMQGQPENADSQLALELGKVSGRTESLNASLASLTENIESFRREFADQARTENSSVQTVLTDIEGLKTLVGQQGHGATKAEIQSALNSLEGDMEHFLNKEVVPLLKRQGENETKSNTEVLIDTKQYDALVDMVKSLQQNLKDVQTEINKQEQPRIQKIDKSKHGLFNWF